MMYMFKTVFVRNNYMVKINEDSYEENIEKANVNDLKIALSKIIQCEMSCKNSFAKSIKNKTFYKILLRLNELRR